MRIKGQPANPSSPGKMAVKTERVWGGVLRDAQILSSFASNFKIGSAPDSIKVSQRSWTASRLGTGKIPSSLPAKTLLLQVQIVTLTCTGDAI